MILKIKAKDIEEGDYILIGEEDYRVYPLWMLVHSANYASRKLQVSTEVGIIKRRYNDFILVYRINPFEEKIRIEAESFEEKRKRSEWYKANILNRFRKGGKILDDGSLVPLSTQ